MKSLIKFYYLNYRFYKTNIFGFKNIYPIIYKNKIYKCIIIIVKLNKVKF